MRRIAAIPVLLLSLFGAPAAAQQVFVPALYSVIGVSDGDALTVREEPSAAADIVARLEPSANGIEVVAVNADGTWGKVGVGERSGWVSMRFLEPEHEPDNVFATNLSCFGTEPFWLLGIVEGVADFSLHGERVEGMTLTGVQPVNVIRNHSFAFDLAAPDQTFSGFVSAGACSDGMSDRDFGWQAMLLMRGSGNLTALQGCCSLQVQ